MKHPKQAITPDIRTRSPKRPGRALRDAFEDLDQALRQRTVKDVMTWGIISVKPETPIREAASVIHANKIGAVPVVERGRVVGMLAVGD